MAVYIYKAINKEGKLVRNRVEEASRFMLLKKLKQNEFLPISVTQINTSRKKAVKRKRNIETSDSILRTVRQQESERKNKSKTSNTMENIKSKLKVNTKITGRDIVTFTQNFYLLKKANFNNIHALSTIIETIENPSLKAIVEDILVGVEAGENMYTTMEYYGDVFPPIYVSMIKVGELSRFFNKSIRTGCTIFG